MFGPQDIYYVSYLRTIPPSLRSVKRGKYRICSYRDIPFQNTSVPYPLESFSWFDVTTVPPCTPMSKIETEPTTCLTDRGENRNRTDWTKPVYIPRYRTVTASSSCGDKGKERMVGWVWLRAVRVPVCRQSKQMMNYRWFVKIAFATRSSLGPAPQLQQDRLTTSFVIIAPWVWKSACK